VIRAREAATGVPSDTRQALKMHDGIRAGIARGERMYPDTDLPPLAIEGARLERIRARLPEPVWTRDVRLAGMGLGAEMIWR